MEWSRLHSLKQRNSFALDIATTSQPLGGSSVWGYRGFFTTKSTLDALVGLLGTKAGSSLEWLSLGDQ